MAVKRRTLNRFTLSSTHALLLLSSLFLSLTQGEGAPRGSNKDKGKKVRNVDRAGAETVAAEGHKAIQAGNVDLCVKRFGEASEMDPTYSDYHTQVYSSCPFRRM